MVPIKYTMSMHRLTTISLALLTSPALAQPADTLRGPSVPRETLESIGSTDMSGNFIPVEGRPELAAFMVVCRDPEDLAAARELGSQRVFDLAEVLVDEIDAVKAITDAIAQGNGAYAQTLLAQLRLRHDPDTLRDPLREDLEAMLNDEERVRFDRILDDYWARWVSANMPEDEQNMQGQPRSRAIYQRIENRLNNQLYQQDIQYAYEHSLRRYRDAMQAMFDALEPTPEQRTWIRDRVIQHIKDTRLRATLEQREALMLEVYEMLDEDRRVKLFSYMTRAALSQAQ